MQLFFKMDPGCVGLLQSYLLLHLHHQALLINIYTLVPSKDHSPIRMCGHTKRFPVFLTDLLN